MKLTVKTLKGSHFEITVQPNHTILAVKKNIEEVQGTDNYPSGQQLLIHSGKVLKDESTLEENKVGEDGFLVVMLSKSKVQGAAGSSSAQPSATTPAPLATQPNPNPETAPQVLPSDAYGQATSNLVAGSNLDNVVEQLMDMGGGNWDNDTVVRALRAAYNNPERAVDYLYSGIPETAEVDIPVTRVPSQASGRATNVSDTAATYPAQVSGIPNSSPLDLFPQGTPSLGSNLGSGTLDFLRDNRQFQQLRAMVQANPHILQPMLQELSKQNPQILRLIQENHAEFLQLLNEPVEGVEGDMFDQPDQEMAHAINVTPTEQEAITRLEALGFDRSLVIEAFLACDRNEELAANYLFEHAGEED